MTHLGSVWAADLAMWLPKGGCGFVGPGRRRANAGRSPSSCCTSGRLAGSPAPRGEGLAHRRPGRGMERVSDGARRGRGREVRAERRVRRGGGDNDTKEARTHALSAGPAHGWKVSLKRQPLAEEAEGRGRRRRSRVALGGAVPTGAGAAKLQLHFPASGNSLFTYC